MKRQISFREYRRIDLFLFAVILIIFEFIITSAASRWFPAQPFSVSAAAAVTAIVMMRWGAFAALHAVLGGLVYCIAAGAAPSHYVIYCAGNLLAMLALLMIKYVGRKRICSDSMMAVVFGLAVQILMQLGRAGVALVLGNKPAVCAGFIATDVLSGLFTVVIIWVVRRLDGLFEDQKTYLLRLQKEREAERGETN